MNRPREIRVRVSLGDVLHLWASLAVACEVRSLHPVRSAWANQHQRRSAGRWRPCTLGDLITARRRLRWTQHAARNRPAPPPPPPWRHTPPTPRPQEAPVTRFANPYLICEDCGNWVTGYDTDTGDNHPCGHAAGVVSVCPSWGPVDGCQCVERPGVMGHTHPPLITQPDDEGGEPW